MSAYKKPGIYISERNNPNAISPAGGSRLAAIVGTGKTVLSEKDIAITKGSADGIDTIPVVASDVVISVSKVGDNPGMDFYTEDVDFTLINNTISWALSVRQPDAGAIYYVTYERAKTSSEYNAILYSNVNDVRDAYGNEIESGVLTSPISVAAKLLFDNNASQVMIVQASTGSDSDLQTALDKLKLEDVDVISMPQATNSTLRTSIRTHVVNESSSALRHERTSFVSGDGMSDTITGLKAISVSQSHKRITPLAPPSFIATFKDAITLNDVDRLLPSTYMGAAYAGEITDVNYDAAEPRTRKTLAGIKNLSEHAYSEVEKDQLAGGNITVVENIYGTIRIRHALTSDSTSINTITQSVIYQVDAFNKGLRTQLDKKYIGTKITAETPAAVASTIQAWANREIAERRLVAIRSITVTQDSTDPRTLVISYDLAPIYPLEFMNVSFTLVSK